MRHVEGSAVSVILRGRAPAVRQATLQTNPEVDERNTEMKGQLIATVCVMFFGLWCAAAQGADLTWAPGVPLQIPRQQTGVTVGADGLIYAIGGVDQGYGAGHVTETVERFSESTQSWAYVASLNTERYGLGSVTDSQGYIWAVAGANLSTFALSSVEVYDPGANTWTAQSSGLNTARRCFGISIAPDGCIFAYGGHGTGNVSLASVEKYDPSNPSAGWTYVASMKEGRVNPGFTADSQGRLYAIGGQYYPTDTILKTAERYDPATDTWKDIADLPKTLSGVAAFTLNGEIWVVGGWEPNHLVSDCYIYSPDTDLWRAGPSMYEDLVTARTAIGLSGLVYVIGGERSAGSPSNHVALLTPEPATLSLLAVGGLALLSRKRR